MAVADSTAAWTSTGANSTSAPSMIPRRLSSRNKTCLGAGLLAVIFLWLITPRSGELYRPRDHANPIPAENQDEEIINSIVIPSYNEALNMAPL